MSGDKLQLKKDYEAKIMDLIYKYEVKAKVIVTDLITIKYVPDDKTAMIKAIGFIEREQR